jgi:CRP-like cAMP-binding protein
VERSCHRLHDPQHRRQKGRLDPGMATTFMARLVRQVQALRSRLEIRNIRPAAERVRQYLLLLSRPGLATIVFDRPLKDVAAEIGLTHEAFYRALAVLANKGAIVRRGREIGLPDHDGDHCSR